jgi:hypothetical protein
MHGRLGDNIDLGDRPQQGEVPTMPIFVPHPNALALNPERAWLYRTPGIPIGSKDRSKRLPNPWASVPALPAETPRPFRPPQPPQPPQPVVTADAPPVPPVPIVFQTPSTVFLNPATQVGPLYEHEAVIIKENPVSALIKAILSTLVLCLGFWFATLLYVGSIVLFFPFAFNAWEGAAAALPGLGISCLIALGMAFWIGEQTNWWWGVLTFFFLPIMYAVYVYKQNRGMVSRSTGRPVAKFPTVATIGLMIGAGMFAFAVSIYFLFHNYSDEMEQNVPPFDRYSLNVQPQDRQVRWAVTSDGYEGI